MEQVPEVRHHRQPARLHFVLRRGGKGRISNELVAASCAAIVAVYAAGTWRTRDADRRFAVEREMRRPARPAQGPVASIPAVVAAAVQQAAPVVLPAAESNANEPKAPGAKATESRPVPKQPVKIDAAPSPDAATVPQTSATATATVAAATAIEVQSAPAPADAAGTGEAETADTPKRWLDGYFTGWGTSRHGDIQSFVRIENGRIIDAGVASCETRWPCDVIEHIIRQPVERQSAEVDRVSRATASADAYYSGLVAALEHAEAGTFKSVRP
jgi:uncharacterized protein with FMN-binding domain